MPWIRRLERKLQWRKRKRERRGREHEIEVGKEGENLKFEVQKKRVICLISGSNNINKYWEVIYCFVVLSQLKR